PAGNNTAPNYSGGSSAPAPSRVALDVAWSSRLGALGQASSQTQAVLAPLPPVDDKVIEQITADYHSLTGVADQILALDHKGSPVPNGLQRKAESLANDAQSQAISL